MTRRRRWLSALLAAAFLFATYRGRPRGGDSRGRLARRRRDPGSAAADPIRLSFRLRGRAVRRGDARRPWSGFRSETGCTWTAASGPDTAAALGVTLRGGSSGSTAASSSAAIVSSDHRLLAKLVYAEARGEPYKGQVAVAAVVLNRVESASFPNTISGVIYQRNAFTCVNNGSINNTPDSSSIRAALDALNGWDPTGGCLYYYNPKTATDDWIRSRTVQTVIGRHHFCT